MVERWSRFVLSNPVWVLVIMTSMCLIAGIGLKEYKNNNDPRIFFSEDNPDYQRFSAMEDRFTPNEVVLFVVHPKNNQIFTSENLAILEELTDAAWTLPFSTRVDSVTNFQHTEVDNDDLYTRYLVEDAENYTDAELEEIKQIALAEPSVQRRLISNKAHVAGVSVTVTMTKGHTEAGEITDAARLIAEDFNARYPDVEFMLTGTVVFSEAAKQATEQAMQVTFPLAAVAMLLCLFLILRSLLFTGIVIVIIILSILSAMGISLALGIEFSPIVSLAPAMILTLAVADCVHILSTYRHERLAGKNLHDAMLESLRVNFQPIWLTSLTTAIGFAILNFSESQPFRALGDVVMGGVLIAFVLSVSVLPALVMLVPHKVSDTKGADYDPAMLAFADWVIRHYRQLLVIMGGAVVICVGVLPLNKINDVFNEYFDESFDVRRVNDFTMRELTGMHRVDYQFKAVEAGGAMEPEYLQAMDDFMTWARAHPDVIYVSGYSDVIKRLNRDMHAGDPEWYQIPEQRDLISQYTLLYELGLPQGLGLEMQLDINKEYGRIIVLLDSIGSDGVLAFDREATQWISDNLPSYTHGKGASMDLLFGNVTMLNIESMLSGAVLALMSVSLLLILALRSWWYGLLSLLPNLLPAAMAFGVWGLINGEIGLAVSIVACMTIGIVVDDTVHFLSKYVRAKKELGLATPDAVRYAFRTVGVALVATSMVLITNFLVIGTSNFYPNSSMGMLSAITIALALVVDFLFFVPLLLVLEKKDKAGEASEPVVG